MKTVHEQLGSDSAEPPPLHSDRTLTRLRIVLAIFIAGLVLSGLTAFSLLRETELLATALGLDVTKPTDQTGLGFWIITVRDGLRVTYAKYPWIAYGTDWLAFAHLVMA